MIICFARGQKSQCTYRGTLLGSLLSAHGSENALAAPALGRERGGNAGAGSAGAAGATGAARGGQAEVYLSPMKALGESKYQVKPWISGSFGQLHGPRTRYVVLCFFVCEGGGGNVNALRLRGALFFWRTTFCLFSMGTLVLLGFRESQKGVHPTPHL